MAGGEGLSAKLERGWVAKIIRKGWVATLERDGWPS